MGQQRLLRECVTAREGEKPVRGVTLAFVGALIFGAELMVRGAARPPKP